MEEAWELAVVSWDLIISVLLSTGVFAVFAVVIIALSIAGSIAIWESIKSEEQVAIKSYPKNQQEKLDEEFFAARTEVGRMQLHRATLSEEDVYFEGGPGLSKNPYSSEYFEINEKTPLRNKFNIDYPDFKERVKNANEKLAPARLLAKIGNIIYVPFIVISGVCLFFFTTDFFGVGLEFESRDDTQRRAEAVEEQQISLIFEIKRDIDLLLSPEELKVGDAQKLTKELPVKLARLKVNLEKQTADNQLVREEFSRTLLRIEREQKELSQLQSLTREQLTAVRSSITQDAEKSSRQYYLLGLFLSIPLFWLSDTIKYLGLTGFRKVALFWHRRGDTKANSRNKIKTTAIQND